MGMLLSSESELISFFIGSAFSGADYIIGKEGYNEFIKNNNTFEADADGNYARGIYDNESNFKIETDFRGFFPLFYYSDSGYWVISDSFTDIVKKVRQKKTLVLREHSLWQWRNNSILSMQLSSDESVFEGIKILGSDEQILISRESTKFSIIKKDRAPRHISYSDAISNLIDVWVSRIKTLINSREFRLLADLSGGLDSRVVFSLIERATRDEDELKKYVELRSSLSRPNDLKVAEYISELYNFSLNKRLTDFRNIPINEEESYKTWFRNNVGRYAPNILPVSHKSNHVITLGGVGGGAFRPAYGNFSSDLSNNAFYNYLSRYKKFFNTNSKFKAWHEETYNAGVAACDRYWDTINTPPIAHGREYRNRHHYNKQHLNELGVCFLGSKLFYEVANSAPKQYLTEGQILYDIMFSLNNDLPFFAHETFDKRIKGGHVKLLSDYGAAISERVGVVYNSEVNLKSERKNCHPNHVLFSEAREILNKNKASALIGKTFKERALSKMDKIEKSGRINKNLHTQGTFLHYIILCDFVESCV